MSRECDHCLPLPRLLSPLYLSDLTVTSLTMPLVPKTLPLYFDTPSEKQHLHAIKHMHDDDEKDQHHGVKRLRHDSLQPQRLSRRHY